MKTESELIQEANAALRRGFNSVDRTWRNYAQIESVEVFSSDSSGKPELITYAKMLSMTKTDVESGYHFAKLIKMGRGAALRFNEVFWQEAGRFGAPSWPDGVRQKTADDSLSSIMSRIRVVVAFLNRAEQPTIDVCEFNDDTVDFRGYFDFGVVALGLGHIQEVKAFHVEKSRYTWGPPITPYPG